MTVDDALIPSSPENDQQRRGEGRAVVNKRGLVIGGELSPARTRKLIKIIGKPKQEVKKKFL
jgi:hypothetical protein